MSLGGKEWSHSQAEAEPGPEPKGPGSEAPTASGSSSLIPLLPLSVAGWVAVSVGGPAAQEEGSCTHGMKALSPGKAGLFQWPGGLMAFLTITAEG